jgi:hypothetical protein
LQDEEELYDAIVDQWVSSRSATLEQQVAGLRLLLACLDCWLFQYPLTEEALVEKLGHWAIGGLNKAAVLGDDPLSNLQPLLEEARQTYAMGERVTWRLRDSSSSSACGRQKYGMGACASSFVTWGLCGGGSSNSSNSSSHLEAEVS